MTHPRADRGVWWLALAGVSWGTSGTLGTLLHDSTGLPFLAVAGYRIFVGGALLGLAVIVTGRARLPRTRSGWTRVLLIGLASAVYQFGFFSAVSLVGVAVATLVTIGATPPMVLTVDVIRGRHRPTVRLGISLAVALGGLALLMGSPTPGASGAGATVAGLALALLAAAGFAAITLLGARPEPDYHDATGTSLAFLFGGALVLGVAAATGTVTFAPSVTSVGELLLLGLVPSAFAYLAYLRGLRTQTGTTGTLVALLEPVTATALATTVLGEELPLRAALGAGLLLVAVVVTTTQRPEPPH